MQMRKNHKSQGIAVPPSVGVGSGTGKVRGMISPPATVEEELALAAVVVEVKSGKSVVVRPSGRVNVAMLAGKVIVLEPSEITVCPRASVAVVGVGHGSHVIVRPSDNVIILADEIPFDRVIVPELTEIIVCPREFVAEPKDCGSPVMAPAVRIPPVLDEVVELRFMTV